MDGYTGRYSMRIDRDTGRSGNAGGQAEESVLEYLLQTEYMDVENTLGLGEYFSYTLSFTACALVNYGSLLFKRLGNLSTAQSWTVIFCLVLLSTASGIFFQIEKERNSKSIFKNILIPLGIYFVISYYDTEKRLILLSFLPAALLSVSNAVSALRYWAREARHFHISILLQLKSILESAASYFILAMLFMMLFVSGRKLAKALPASISAIWDSITEDFEDGAPQPAPGTAAREGGETIAKNLDTLRLLREESWSAMSNPQKLQVLQVVANIERNYLGLENELTVMTKESFPISCLGAYDDAKHQIYINADYLSTASAEQILATLCHEAYHSAQYRLLDLYRHSESSAQALIFFESARKYDQEFKHYIDGIDDYCAYAAQACETDARAYAEEARKEYLIRIQASPESAAGDPEGGDGQHTFRR